MQRKIFVAGGAGFIGSVLTRNLAAQGHAVTVFDKQPTRVAGLNGIVGDVRDLPALTKAMQGHEVAFNLAAEHRDDVRPLSLYDEVNVQGAANLCQAAVQTGIETIVFTSSVAVYGESEAALKETDAHRYINDYGRTKSQAEEKYLAWAQEAPGRNLTIIRPTVVFGPGNRGNVYNIINQIARNRFLMVGGGTNRKSMAYVDNIADFLAFGMENAGGVQIYNYADKPDFNMHALVTLLRTELGKGTGIGPRLPKPVAMAVGTFADAVSAVSGKRFPISRVRVQKFCANTEIDSSRALATGFSPRIALKDGLQTTIRADFPSKS